MNRRVFGTMPGGAAVEAFCLQGGGASLEFMTCSFGGLCLECEGYPAGMDFPEFGEILVRPGAPQRRATHYAFSTIN